MEPRTLSGHAEVKGSYIALLTGFYVDNGPALPLWNQLPHWTYWTIPAFVGTPLIWNALRRFNTAATGKQTTRRRGSSTHAHKDISAPSARCPSVAALDAPIMMARSPRSPHSPPSAPTRSAAPPKLTTTRNRPLPRQPELLRASTSSSYVGAASDAPVRMRLDGVRAV
jgi:hypothetical protein